MSADANSTARERFQAMLEQRLVGALKERAKRELFTLGMEFLDDLGGSDDDDPDATVADVADVWLRSITARAARDLLELLAGERHLGEPPIFGVFERSIPPFAVERWEADRSDRRSPYPVQRLGGGTTWLRCSERTGDLILWRPATAAVFGHIYVEPARVSSGTLYRLLWGCPFCARRVRLGPTVMDQLRVRTFRTRRLEHLRDCAARKQGRRSHEVHDR